MNKPLWLLPPLLGSIIIGCADVRAVAVTLSPSAPGSPPHLITFTRDLSVEPAAAAERTLRAGSVWSLTGSLPQGDVYKPRDTVFTLQRLNMHEAYLVLSGGTVVGYYLPAENSFVPEPRPFKIPIQ